MKKQNDVIVLDHVTKEYINGDITTSVLHNVTFTVKKGDFLAITGPSGSGKSTLLNILGLLDNPSGGTYLLNEHNVTNLTEDEQADIRSKEIGFVFQSFNLLKRVTVLDNVILPAIYAGIGKAEREERAKDLLTQVGLSDQIYKIPNQLSGGQQQRVAIARALMNNPTIILADEPTGNLDTKSGQDVMEILKKLNREGRTIIIITHERDIAQQTKRTVFIRDGIMQKGSYI